MLYNMSHELRTPIHSIMSDCEVLSTSVIPHEKQQAIEETHETVDCTAVNRQRLG